MPSLGWRWLLGLSSAPLALLLLLYPLLPESPRFHMVKNRPTDARRTLDRMAKLNRKSLPNGQLVANKRRPAKEGIVDVDHNAEEGVRKEDLRQEEKAGPFAVLGTLVSPPYLRSTALLWSVFFANAFTYYGLVLLTSELTGGAGRCGEGAQVVQASTAGGDTFYRDIFITSFAGTSWILLIYEGAQRSYGCKGLRFLENC